MKPKQKLFVVGLALASYSAAYAGAFHFRSPAANLAYWCYTPENFPAWSEAFCCALFRPAYAFQRAAFDGPRHNFDREEMPAEAPSRS